MIKNTGMPEIKQKDPLKSSKGKELKVKGEKSSDNEQVSDIHNNIINQYKLAGDNNNLTTNDIFRLLDLYFYKEFYTYRHLHDSFDKFIDDTIPNFLREGSHVFSEFITEDRYIRHKFVFTNIRMDSPKLSNGIDPMFPADARHLATPYSMIIYADITQVKEVIDINTSGKNNITTTVVGRTEQNRPAMIVPTMIRSKYCNLNVYKEETRDECRFDPGGYFIVNGSEKVVICQDGMIRNSPMVFVKKNSNVSYNVVQVNSKSSDPMGMMQAMSIKMKKDGEMIAKIPILYEVNVITIFRALGIESDRDIIDYCVYDQTDSHMIELLRSSLDTCINDNDDMGTKIQTQEEAIDYLITKMRVVKKYTESNQKTKLEQRKLHLMDLFKTSFLPHIEGAKTSDPYREKAFYLGYMINKLLNVQLGRAPMDNRDSYCKKRVDNIRELFEEIMIQQYKNNMAECNKQFIARMGDNIDAEEVYNVIHQFKAGTFEQGFKASLMLGNWPRKKGVSQMMQRFSYMQLLSFLSRIDSQSGTQSSSKLTKPRQVDPSSIPYLCITGDSEVLLSDNISVTRIKDMKNGDSVRTAYKSDLKEISTPITNYFSKMGTDLVEIETISGRKIKCTKNHPILTINEKTGDYQMIDAGDLTTDHRVIVRHMEKYLDIDKEVIHIIKPEDVKNKNYLNSLLTLGYIDKPISQQNLEIFARIIGYLMTTNKVYNRKIDLNDDYIDVKFIEEHDLKDFIEDVKLIGFDPIYYDNTSVRYENVFLYIVFLLGGLAQTVPDWIVNSNNRIKREFLAGINRISAQDLNRKFVNQIKSLYDQINIKSVISEKNDTYKCLLDVSNHEIENLCNIVMPRYNIKEKVRYAILAEFCRYANRHSSYHMDKDTFISKYYLNGLNFAIPIRSINKIPDEMVYDFTTESDTHTFIANSIVLSNCSISTPEHAKIGLIKHLTMIGSLTIGDRDNTELVKEFIITHPMVKKVYEVPVTNLKNMFKVFLNGEWMGVVENKYEVGNQYTDNPVLKFYADGKVKKITGAFNPQMTSIAFDHKDQEIRFCTDSGRLYRPVIRVNGDNEMMLTKQMIDQISLKATDKNKISDWDEFYMQEPYPIEFIDSEEQPYQMIAEDRRTLNEERVKIINSLNFKFTGDESKIVNRYDDKFFVKYDSVEIHPSVLLGEIATNIPFGDKNCAPRNIFQYAQGRQGMGIYCTVYRSRTDISYVLYNPEVPVVNTRTSKYTYTDILPPGSNAVVAIACYSGLTVSPCRNKSYGKSSDAGRRFQTAGRSYDY